jgi:lipopolysaccharide heptosyltransferase I
MKSLLIVRLGAIGDVVHSLAAARLIREKRPDIRLGWLVDAGAAAQLLRGNPMLDVVHEWPRKAWRREGLAAFLRKSRAFFRDDVAAAKWDAALDLQGLLKSGLAAKLAGARDRVGFAGADSREGNALFMSRRCLPPRALRHVVEKNVLLAAAAIDDEATLNLATQPDAFRAFAMKQFASPPLPPNPQADERVAGLLATATGEAEPRPIILLNPGGAWESKRWPAPRFGELAARLAARDDCRIFGVAYAPNEAAMRDAILDAAGEARSRFLDLPPLDFLELAALCRQARLFVAGDTGPLHLASAMGTPCVALYGGSDPERNGPFDARSLVVDAQAGRGKARVPYRKDPIGLTGIAVERVAEACSELLG